MQGQLEQLAEGLARLSFGYLRSWRSRNTSGQSVTMLSHFVWREKVVKISLVANEVHCPLSYCYKLPIASVLCILTLDR